MVTLMRERQHYFRGGSEASRTAGLPLFRERAQGGSTLRQRLGASPGSMSRTSPHEEEPMTEKTIDLDKHRGMAAQKETRLRRLHTEVREQRDALRTRQDALEEQLVAAPAESWEDAAEKARYLLTLFATSVDAQDPRRQKLIAAVLDDFERLSGDPLDAPKEET
jgi:hypothetical protein